MQLSEIPSRNEARSERPHEQRHAQDFLLSDVVGWKVRTKAGAKLGKSKDFVARDDPKYAEVTHLIVGRLLRRPFAEDSWSDVAEFGPKQITVQSPPEGGYAEIDLRNLLLLRDKVLDKRVLDTTGFAVEVVYDIQLSWWRTSSLWSPRDVSRHALLRRLGLGRLGGGRPKDVGEEGFIPWKYVQPLAPDLTPTKGDAQAHRRQEPSWRDTPG